MSCTMKTVAERLTAAGVNPTAQRMTIYRYLTCESNHPTADDVKQWVDAHFPKLSLATIYNTLKTLVEANLVKEFKLPHSSKVIYDTNTTPHCHFLDEETGQLHDIDPRLIDLSPEIHQEYEVFNTHILLSGKRRRRKRRANVSPS